MAKNNYESIMRIGYEPFPCVSGIKASAGDHIVLKDGTICMVCDSCFYDDSPFVIVKYVMHSQKNYEKIPDAFSATQQFRQWMKNRNINSIGPFGFDVLIPTPENVVGTIPAISFKECLSPPLEPLLEELQNSGVDVDNVRITGSRGIGLSYSGSDWDIIVPILPEQIPICRRSIANAVLSGKLNITEGSSIWQVCESHFPGGKEAILEQALFAERISIGGERISLIFVPDKPPCAVCGASWNAARGTICGIVADDSCSGYFRSELKLITEDGHSVELVCMNKLGSIIKKGDRISADGWILTSGNKMRLVQFYRDVDKIRWY